MTATGNHFFLDSIAGLAVAGLTVGLLFLITTAAEQLCRGAHSS